MRDRREFPTDKRKTVSYPGWDVNHCVSSSFPLSVELVGPTRVGAIRRFFDLVSSFSLSLVAPKSRLPSTEPLIELVAE